MGEQSASQPGQTLEQWWRSAWRYLSECGVEAPDLSALLILEHVTGLSRATILAYGERLLSPSDSNLADGLLKRRAKHEPIEYLTGRAVFREFDLKVDSAVLIPRPETEELVDLIVSRVASPARLVDAGTGSGCLALALAHQFPNAQVIACDCSLSALKVARTNLTAPNVWLLGSNWLSALADHSCDLVVSNPPYITPREMAELDEQVGCFEPLLALDGGDDGAAPYRILINQAARVLRGGGWLFVESSPVVIPKVQMIMQSAGFENIELHLDLSGKDRFVSATTPTSS